MIATRTRTKAPMASMIATRTKTRTPMIATRTRTRTPVIATVIYMMLTYNWYGGGPQVTWRASGSLCAIIKTMD